MIEFMSKLIKKPPGDHQYVMIARRDWVLKYTSVLFVAKSFDGVKRSSLFGGIPSEKYTCEGTYCE